MMDISQKRKAVSERYNAPHWWNRVEKMPDYQVAAIYERMISEKENNK